MMRSNVHETAAAGVADNSAGLPHLDRIQESFGRAHDLSGIQAAVGGEAARAASAIGAEAYVTGERAAFQRSPDPRVAAHAPFETHRDFLKRLVMGLSEVGPITGSLDRDMGVATELGTRTWAQVANPAAADDSADHDSLPSAETDQRRPLALDVAVTG